MEAKKLVDILGWIYVVWAALGILAGLVIAFVGYGVFSALGDFSFMGTATVLWGLLIVVLSVVVLWAALQLMKGVPWTRWFFLVVAVLGFGEVLIGWYGYINVAIGLYAIWLLGFNKEVVALFGGTPAETPAEQEMPPELPESTDEAPPELPSEEK